MRLAVHHQYFGSPASHLRSIVFLEGVSYVLLLFIAMPLKYLGDLPAAVSVVGPILGVLFIWLGMLVVGGIANRRRPMSWAVRIMVAALLPFGMLVIDRSLKAEVVAREGTMAKGEKSKDCAKSNS